MGHEAIIYGRIEGVAWRSDRYRLLQGRNSAVLARLPEDDPWPALVRGMFSLPVPWPTGTYRQQVIHFGGSFKDEPGDTAAWAAWVGKFEGLLRQLCWLTAVVHLETEFGPPRTWRWQPTDAAIARLGYDDPVATDQWTRTEQPTASPDLTP